MNQPFNAKILQVIGKSLTSFPKQPLIIAYSGGVDSQALLHAVAQLSQNNNIANPIQVCHVHHGLSANADQWARFATEQCQQLKLPLTVVKVDVVRDGNSLEANARDARYQALAELASQAGIAHQAEAVVLTGHHLDDQAETLLLALKRGAGVKGLSAMAKQTRLKDLLLLRPMLAVSREDIETYANACNLEWVDDDSNTDVGFDRNFIRHQIMPTLVKRWPGMATTMARSAEHCQDAQQLIDEVAQQDLALCLRHNNVLSVSKLLTLSTSRFNFVMRSFLTMHQLLMPSAAQLVQIKQQLNADRDKVPAIKIDGMWLRRFQDELHLTPEYAELSDWLKKINIANELSDNVVIGLPDNLGKLKFAQWQEQHGLDNQAVMFSLPNNASELHLTFSHNNPKCLPDYRAHSRSLKKIWQELAVPTWQRKRIPLIFCGDQLVAALGYFVCKEFLADRHTFKVTVDYVS